MESTKSSSPDRSSTADHPGAPFVKCGSVPEVPPGTAKTVNIDGKLVALCNVDGRIFAIADVCTHDNGPLGQGELCGYEIECPRHGARFDVRTGEVLCLPAIVPVPTFKVEIRGTDVYVNIQEPCST